ncbi:endonuclease III [Candidatus Dependentiae bacterium]|nr:endonuclease III [Candidatus Dependentiae bacterium]
MNILQIVETLRRQVHGFQIPLINLIMQEFGHDPYLILIACLLSLRARDVMTIHVCRELFSRVKTPQQLLELSQAELEHIIYRTGYYKTKARVLRSVSHDLIERFQGKVPKTYQEIMSIKGVGPKTANLVLGWGYGVPGICVDTHVHRISNRLGIIQTKTVAQTEAALKNILPQDTWIEYNKLLVMWGQNVCVPISPFCSRCPLKALGCKRIGVTRSR